ncbi:hypothetical protein [Advenella faeciporci]|nr:hypothetical protein [Advenella faeciporci]
MTLHKQSKDANLIRVGQLEIRYLQEADYWPSVFSGNSRHC